MPFWRPWLGAFLVASSGARLVGPPDVRGALLALDRASRWFLSLARPGLLALWLLWCCSRFVVGEGLRGAALFGLSGVARSPTNSLVGCRWWVSLGGSARLAGSVVAGLSRCYTYTYTYSSGAARPDLIC